MRSLNPSFLFTPTVRVALPASHRGLVAFVLFTLLPATVGKTFSFAECQFVAFLTRFDPFFASITPPMFHAKIGAAMCAFWTIWGMATLATAVAYAFPTRLCILLARLLVLWVNVRAAAPTTVSATLSTRFSQTVASFNRTSSTSTVLDTLAGPTGSTARTARYLTPTPTAMFYAAERAALCMFIAPRLRASTPASVGRAPSSTLGNF